MYYGGIETGGTKMICAVGDGEGNIMGRVKIPTRMPDNTIPEMIDFFKTWDIKALGIGSFGPLDLKKDSVTYGQILNTPKEGWDGCDLVGQFERALGVPVALDTDVNVAVFGEVKYGAARGCESAIYITVGTGIGVGVYVSDRLLHGLTHPESGHILVERNPKDDFKGCCKCHRNCFEGLASGVALEKRYGKKAEQLYDRDDVWELESDYIASAVANYILTYSPEKIVIWGGVMHQEKLFDMIRQKAKKLLGGYITSPVFDNMEDYIVKPGLGDDSGIVGACELAKLV